MTDDTPSTSDDQTRTCESTDPQQIEPLSNERPEATIRSDTTGSVSVSRRSLLGALLAVGGAGAWAVRDRLFDSATAPNQKPNQQSRTIETNPPWRQEAAVLERAHGRDFSRTPSFDYGTVTADGAASDEPISRITASGTQSGSGDRVIFRVEQGFGQDLAGIMVATGANPAEADDRRVASIQGREYTFSLHTGDEITVAKSVVEAPDDIDREDVLVARGTDPGTVRDLVDSFDGFYSEHLR